MEPTELVYLLDDRTQVVLPEEDGDFSSFKLEDGGHFIKWWASTVVETLHQRQSPVQQQV